MSANLAADTVVVSADRSVTFNVRAKSPPGTFAVWGTSPSDVFMTREIIHTVSPGEFDEGRPIVLRREQATITFRRIPDGYAPLAGEDGLRLMMENLQSAEAAWKQHVAN